VISAAFPSSNPAIALLPDLFRPSSCHSAGLAGYPARDRGGAISCGIMVMP
jgi:hypothetical protein